MRKIEVTLPRPLPWQAQVVAEAARFNVLAIGRRAGKTALGVDRCADPAVLPSHVGWFSPTYKDMLEVWREVTRRLAPVTTRANAAERRIELLTGGVLEFWSLTDANAGRGRKYRRVIIDEAAFVPTLLDAWNYAIRPTLTDLAGDAWIMSTPKGRNGFHHLWQWGQDPERPDWRAWQMPSNVNPLIPASELEEMRRNYPERVYSQEILAAFVEDAGGVFRRVMDAATATPQEQGQRGRAYVAGVDLARKVDFTVITIIDISGQVPQVVYVDRFNQVDWAIQVGRIKAAADRFDVEQLIVDQTGVGDPITEQLQRELRCAVVGTQITNATKSNMINALALAFERNEISIIPDAVLINELQAYEMERLPSGLMRYNAPEGLHDDCVMSLALAYQAVAQPQWLLG